MDGHNVVPFPVAKISSEDADVIEAIMHFYCSGDEVPLSRLEATTEPLVDIVERLRLEGAVLQLDSQAFRFRVAQWKFKQQKGKRLVLIVIDQGGQRFLHYRTERTSIARLQGS
ncbi:hypothetical protein [Lysobacter sp. CA196]|uniref:hypothetical protein n=1 Tax=Lysobacter sp. CA196 TaxID=3455606 RepID=UPI003F8D67DE